MSRSKTDRRERPIPFTGPMVLAILDGRKTQTRRVIKPQPVRVSDDWDQLADPGETVMRHGWPCRLVESRGRNKRAAGILTPVEKRCPYGQPGDYLYVREGWCPGRTCVQIKGTKLKTYIYEIIYKVDDSRERRSEAETKFDGRAVWRSSRYMPKWASRITLEVTGVRVERVQDISEGDAITEGLIEFFWPDDLHPEARARGEGKRYWEHVIKKRGRKSSVWDCPIKAFKELWDDINSKPRPVMSKGKVVSYVSYPWGVHYPRKKLRETCEYRGLPWHVYGNPWCWVVEFKAKGSD